MMELFQLETFLAVAEEKSFSRAAARMHRTQSAVSQTISKLEDELGERLFDRSSRDGSLTDAGQVLQTYAKELLNVREEAREALKELRMLHQGKLVIAANEFTARYLLPVLHMFHRMHPMIRIQVMRTLAREVPGQVLNHRRGIRRRLVPHRRQRTDLPHALPRRTGADRLSAPSAGQGQERRHQGPRRGIVHRPQRAQSRTAKKSSRPSRSTTRRCT